jgi:glycosyltransferase involved in cell wall biosynthesis
MSNNKRIDKVLEALFEPRRPEIETIVIDRYSTDSTRDVCSRFPVRFVQKQGGRSAALNTGISLAKGRWVIILDSDMVPSEGLLSECLELLSRENVSCIAVDDFYVSYRRDSRWFDAASLHNIEVAAGIGDSSRTNLIVFRKDLVWPNPLDDSITLGEDYLLAHHALTRADNVHKLSAKIFHYHEPSPQSVVGRSYFYGRVFNAAGMESPASFLKTLSLLDFRRFCKVLQVLRRTPRQVPVFGLYIWLKYSSFGIGLAVTRFEKTRRGIVPRMRM